MLNVKSKKRSVLFLASLSLVVSAGTLVAATLMQQSDPDGMQEKMQKAMEAYSTPGKGQKFLALRDGDWNWIWTMWMGPNGQTMSAKGEVDMDIEFGGRYLVSEIEGSIIGQPGKFKALNIVGYNNARKVFVSSMLSSEITGIDSGVGTPNADWTQIDWVQQETNPMTGKVEEYRAVEKIEGQDKFTITEYRKGPGGKEYKSVHLVFTRDHGHDHDHDHDHGHDHDH